MDKLKESLALLMLTYVDLCVRHALPPVQICTNLRIFPDARNETEEVIKPRRERAPDTPQAPDKPQVQALERRCNV